MNSLEHRCRGIVRDFDKCRGQGTIDVETGEQVFVRYSAIVGEGLRILRTGDRVSFNIVQSPRGLSAVNVMRD